MWQKTRRAFFLFALTAILLLSLAEHAGAQAGITARVGTLADGATYLIEVPPNWNGTLFLYSHGYVIPAARTTPVPRSDRPLVFLAQYRSFFQFRRRTLNFIPVLIYVRSIRARETVISNSSVAADFRTSTPTEEASIESTIS